MQKNGLCIRLNNVLAIRRFNRVTEPKTWTAGLLPTQVNQKKRVSGSVIGLSLPVQSFVQQMGMK